VLKEIVDEGWQVAGGEEKNSMVTKMNHKTELKKKDKQKKAEGNDSN
jgi:hypothetical protein